MKKRLSIATLCLAAAFGSAMAVPAIPETRTVVQPDGTTVTVRQVGDEFHHFIQSADGQPLVKGDDGFYYYMTVDGNGRTCSSGVRVTSPQAVSYKASADFGKVFEALNADGVKMRANRRRVVPDGNKFRDTTFPTKGNIRTLVLLVAFSDKGFVSMTPNEDFTAMLNNSGYAVNGACGSANDWFRDSSTGQFSPTFDVVGPITLDKPVAYYGGNGPGGIDQNSRQMPLDACEMIDGEVDFSLYDEDNDGVIDNVFIFYAGYGEHLGPDYEDTIWAHSWDVGAYNKYYDGKKLSHYACTSELEKDGRMCGIGAFVHEFCHVMGLSDHYSTEYNGAFTPGEWDVMDTGEHNNTGHTPPRLNSFERYSLGWLVPEEIGLEAANLTLGPIEENRAFIITTNKENEFFLLENRQNETWDAYLPYHGMLIWHVDFNSSIWMANKVNNDPNHQYFDLVEADGTQSDGSRNGDCFPGKRKKTSFTDSTFPAMETWAGVKVGKPITDIQENDGIISFKILGGVDTDPDPGHETGIDGIAAGNDGEVRYYNLQGVEIMEPEAGTLCIKVSGNKATKVIIR